MRSYTHQGRSSTCHSIHDNLCRLQEPVESQTLTDGVCIDLTPTMKARVSGNRIVSLCQAMDSANNVLIKHLGRRNTYALNLLIKENH